jgi:glycosyltransferase involved in cell wall biosynthesis
MVAMSNIEAQELEQDGIGQERVRVRPNGLSIASFIPLPERGALRRQLGIPLDVPLILSLGRIAAIKGLLHFAEALRRLDGFWGLIVGPVERDGTFEALVRAREKLSIGERLVLVPGGMWGHEKAAAYADADALCMGSISESFGNVALEAAASGIPVVITDSCGVVDWLEPTATRVVPYGDITKLAGAIKDAIVDQGVREAARRTAPGLIRKLDWHAVAASQAAIYSEVI